MSPEEYYAQDPNAAARLAQAQADADANYYAAPSAIASAPQPVVSNPADYYGPPPPPVQAPTPPVAAGPAPIVEDPNAIASTGVSTPAASLMSGGGAPRNPVSFERSGPPGDPYAKPREPEAFTRTMRSGVPVGRGGGGPGDFGVKGANAALLGSYDEQKAAMSRAGNAEADKIAMLGEGHAALAQERADDAAIDRMAHEQAAQRFDDHLTEMQRQLDDVRSKKLDPNKYMHDREGMGFVAVLGGLVGGLYQGLANLSKNPFLEDLNVQIDRQMAADEKNLANERAGIGDQMNLLREQRSVYKDNELARLQARNLYYEAAKEHLAAQAAGSDSEIAKANADHGIAIVNTAQKQLDRDIKVAARREALAAGAAAAAQARAERRQAIEDSLKLYELDIKKAEALGKGGKEQRAGLAELSKREADPKLAEAEQLITDLTSKVVDEKGDYDITKKVPGVGHGADTREELFPAHMSTAGAAGTSLIPGYGLAREYGKLNPEERIGRQDWERAAEAYKVAVTGAGASPKEVEQIKTIFEGQKTAAEQVNAIRLANKTLESIRAHNRAGFEDDVVDYYDTRTKEERTKLKPAGRKAP